MAKYFEELRSNYKLGQTAEYKRMKEALKAFVVTGRFSSGKSGDSLHDYTGMLVLDFDHLGNKLKYARAAIVREPYTYACFLSPSGDGLKVLVKVDSGSVDHCKAFTAVANHYEIITKAAIDRIGKNINRLCFLSYDPNLYVNDQARKFHIPESMRNLKQQVLF